MPLLLAYQERKTRSVCQHQFSNIQGRATVSLLSFGPEVEVLGKI